LRVAIAYRRPDQSCKRDKDIHVLEEGPQNEFVSRIAENEFETIVGTEVKRTLLSVEQII
jgi:hypothetical protein